MTDLATNILSYGDNLDLLRRYLPDATAAQLKLISAVDPDGTDGSA